MGARREDTVAVTTSLAWHLRGTVFIACNCDFGCPCNFNALPTHGDCEGGWTWHIDEGVHGEVRLDGLNFSVLADWPQAIHMGNGKALVLVDEKADESQRRAIEELVRGEMGGPWALFASTWNEVYGPLTARYEVYINGDRSEVRAGDIMQLELEPIKNPVTGAESHPRVVLPEGIIIKEGSLVASKSFSVKDGVSYDHSGKYAAFGPFEYKGP